MSGSYQHLQSSGRQSSIRHLARALRVSFPLRGSLAATGTPLCFRDTVLTVAHLNNLHGDATASPRGLRVSIPNLQRPGKFSSARTVSDYMLADGRGYNPAAPPPVANDFMLLQLASSLPQHLQPLLMPPLAQLRNAEPPTCDQPTANAAYHDDLGFALDQVRSSPKQSGPIQIKNAGFVPLVTFSSSVVKKNEDPALFGAWYRDPLVALTTHDTQTSASGSAIVCPAEQSAEPHNSRSADLLHGIIVGHTVVDKSGVNGMRNVTTINLLGIYRALARLKGIAIGDIELACAHPETTAAAVR